MTWTFPHTSLWWSNMGMLLFQTISVVYLFKAIMIVRRQARAMKKDLKELMELKEQLKKQLDQRFPDWKSL